MGPVRRRMRPHGFTLIELLVVVSIMVLLLGVLLPSLRGAREATKRAVCLSNLKQLGNATTMYMIDFNEKVPLGPSNRIRVMQTSEGTLVTNLTTCHWGGRRAGWQHGPFPEQERRPLTPYLYRHATLDMPTPVFHCPSDRPTEWSQSLIPGAPIYEVCGNSYYLNMYGQNQHYNMIPKASTSEVILFMEAPLHELLAKQKQGYGWHRQFSVHNVAFLDMHAEAAYIDSRSLSGPHWNVTDFIAMDGFYQN